MKVDYIDYEDAEKIKEALVQMKTMAPNKVAREATTRLLQALKPVRDIDYGLTKGYQLILDDRDYEFYENVRKAVGV